MSIDTVIWRKIVIVIDIEEKVSVVVGCTGDISSKIVKALARA